MVVEAECPANCPTLKGLIQEDVNLLTDDLKRPIQSLEAKLAKAKNVQGNGKKSKGNAIALKNTKPAKVTLKSKALSKKKKSTQKSVKKPPTKSWEREREEHRCSQIMRAIKWRVRNLYGFLPAPNLSTHMKTRQILGDMLLGCYFLKTSNNTFHDLTQDKALPPMATSHLRLGLKFIPTPQYSPLAYQHNPLP